MGIGSKVIYKSSMRVLLKRFVDVVKGLGGLGL